MPNGWQLPLVSDAIFQTGNGLDLLSIRTILSAVNTDQTAETTPWVVVNPLADSVDEQTVSIPGPAGAAQSVATSAGKKKKNAMTTSCKFWGTSTGRCFTACFVGALTAHDETLAIGASATDPDLGCRAGDQCRFYHDPAVEASSSTGHPSTSAPQRARQYNAAPVAASRAVPKPVPSHQTEDPRTFEIKQVRRRFSPKETSFDQGTDLAIKMPPSDPDFPFELDFLDCVLHVPIGYPASGSPTLRVHNESMERVHQSKIEQGFSSIVTQAPKSTLLAYLNKLDRQLEHLLSGERNEITFKLVANRGRPDPLPSSTAEPSEAFEDADNHFEHLPPLFSDDDLREAAMTRATEVRQLEARLGRLPLYARVDEYTFTLPLEPRLRNELPEALQSVRTVHLHVPEVYPLETCTVTIPGVLAESAVLAEAAFEERAIKHKSQTLMAHVNNLAQNLHVFAAQIEEPIATTQVDTDIAEVNEVSRNDIFEEDHRSHVHYISRPPEWDDRHEESSEEEHSTDDDEMAPDEDESDGEKDATAMHAPAPGPDRGFAVDFVHMEFGTSFKATGLQGAGIVAVAEITNFALTAQCLRCKTVVDLDLPGKSNSERLKDPTLTGSTQCPRCTSMLDATFRPRPITAAEPRAGFLECNGFRPLDIRNMESQMLLTCAECTHTFPEGGAQLRYWNSNNKFFVYDNVCRRSLCVSWHYIHFLLQSTRAHSGPLPPRRALKLSEQELYARRAQRGGTALPKNGACDHYAQSFRWFRFGCCAKPYACDRCHDAAEDHVCERASRMICGFCARDQRFHPTRCERCAAHLVKKSSRSGFWEGGKGTRDKAKMSRKGMFFVFAISSDCVCVRVRVRVYGLAKL